MNSSEADSLISALESLCARVQNVAEKQPENVESELEAAMAIAGAAISKAMPGEEKAPWLAELDEIQESKSKSTPAGSTRPDKAGSSAKQPEGHEGAATPQSTSICRCDGLPTIGAGDANRGVPCIHGCRQRFCSAACRRQKAREHRERCDALVKKALLKRVGLGGDEELF